LLDHESVRQPRAHRPVKAFVRAVDPTEARSTHRDASHWCQPQDAPRACSRPLVAARPAPCEAQGTELDGDDSRFEHRIVVSRPSVVESACGAVPGLLLVRFPALTHHGRRDRRTVELESQLLGHRNQPPSEQRVPASPPGEPRDRRSRPQPWHRWCRPGRTHRAGPGTLNCSRSPNW
jgi:hypothetical protein